MTKKKLLKALAIATIATSLVACSGKSDSNDQSTTTDTTADNTSTTAQTPTKAIEKTTTNKDDVTADASYTIGYGMGSSIANDPNLKSYGLNADKVIAGFEAALNKKNPSISQSDIDSNMKELRDTMMKKISEERVSNFLKVKDSIYRSDLTPKSDVKSPDVVIYEFFDYQCMYCAKLYPELETIMAKNKDVQVVFAEFPIFGNRWSPSEYAAEVGTAIYKLYGADAYVKFHNGIFATGEDEGKLEDATIDKVATSAGANITDVKKAIKDDKITEHLEATMKMGSVDLGIQGTPFLVIAPTKGANADNTTVIAGYTDSTGIQKAIKKAQASNTDANQVTEQASSDPQEATQSGSSVEVQTNQAKA